MSSPKIILVWLTVVAFSVIGCTKTIEYINAEAPTIKITDVKVLSDESCSVEVVVDKGVGVSVKEVYVAVNNLGTENSSVVKHKITLSDERIQTSTIRIETGAPFVDHRIQVCLETDKNTYKSEPKIVYFSKNPQWLSLRRMRLLIEDTEKPYIDQENGIGLFRYAGEQFTIDLDYPAYYPLNTKFDVTLKGTSTLDVKNEWGRGNDNLVYVTLPHDIMPGVYEVNVTVEDQELVLPQKIKVLPINFEWSYLSWNSGVDERWFQTYLVTSFTDKDKIYHTKIEQTQGDNTYYISTISVDVKSKIIEPKVTLKLEDLDRPYYDYYSLLHPRYDKSEGKYAFVLRMKRSFDDVISFRVHIWSYDISANTWAEKTQYPGQGIDNVVAFENGDDLYIGGGMNMRYYPYGKYTDFWKFNRVTNQWTRLNDLPSSMKMDYPVCATWSITDEYVLDHGGVFWKFNFQNHTWQKIGITNNVGSYFFVNWITSDKGKIFIWENTYYVTQSFFNIWQFDINTGKKELYTKTPYIGTFETVTSIVSQGRWHIGYLSTLNPATGNYEPAFIEVTL